MQRWTRLYITMGAVMAAALLISAYVPVALSIQAGDDTAIRQATATPTTRSAPLSDSLEVQPQGTPEPFGIRVWWPYELWPAEGTAAEEVLQRQFDGFRQTSTYTLDVRTKHADGTGGILATLRAAVPVAPDAIPDLTLMRRSDLLTAVSEGIAVPLDEWVPDDIMGNLLPGTRALGEVDGAVYGVPYTLTTAHVAYRSSALTVAPRTFQDVLIEAPLYAFPASDSDSATNWTALLQYLAAGGRLVDESGVPTLDKDALRPVLEYYQAGLEAGLFDTALLGFTGATSYQSAFANGDVNMVYLDSTTFLKWRRDVPNTAAGPIPTLDAAPITTLDGWMWVLTTRDPDHQQQARVFLSWMMRINQQSIYTEALGTLPSQSRALRLWEDEAYAEFVQTIVPVGVMPGPEHSNQAARALQKAVADVLRGASADVALDSALSELGL